MPSSRTLRRPLLAQIELPPAVMLPSRPLHRRVEAESLSRIHPILPTHLGFPGDTAWDC